MEKFKVVSTIETEKFLAILNGITIRLAALTKLLEDDMDRNIKKLEDELKQAREAEEFKKSVS